MHEAIKKLSDIRSAVRQQVTDIIVNEGMRLTGSQIGYFATLDDSGDHLIMLGWSKTAMVECGIIDKPLVYVLAETGLWGNAIRERQPSLCNDYEHCSWSTKRGYPADHVTIIRHLSVPIWSQEKIVGILGVGNKSADYTEEDVKMLQSFANIAWEFF